MAADASGVLFRHVKDLASNRSASSLCKKVIQRCGAAATL
jgi:hypothetical protein